MSDYRKILKTWQSRLYCRHSFKAIVRFPQNLEEAAAGEVRILSFSYESGYHLFSGFQPHVEVIRILESPIVALLLNWFRIIIGDLKKLDLNCSFIDRIYSALHSKTGLFKENNHQ